MSRLLAVFCSESHQGTSVINHVLSDQELSSMYRIRAITGDISSNQGKTLKEMGEIDIIQCNRDEPASLERALEGVDTVFALTTSSLTTDTSDVEYSSGMAIADAAVKMGAKYIIYSTQPSVTTISSGKYNKVTMFDAKAKVEQYIRSLPIDSAFIAVGGNMGSFHIHSFLRPQKAPNGTWVLTRPIPPGTLTPLIDEAADAGKFVGAILAEPDKFKGKMLAATEKLYKIADIAAIMSRSTGQDITYKQVTFAEFTKNLPAHMGTILEELLRYQQEFTYYGPESEFLVRWSSERARGKLSTLEEYFKTHPLRLE